jgi:hypothetical protein
MFVCQSPLSDVDSHMAKESIPVTESDAVTASSGTVRPTKGNVKVT